jgi:thioredoxin-like negative regulator of GroEL
MKPVVDGLKTEYQGKVEFRLINLDTDPEGDAKADQFGVQFVPTFVFLNSDGTTNAQLAGPQTVDGMRRALDALQ